MPGSTTLRGLGWVVMDEVHYLADRFRGAVWEEVIIHLPPDVSVVSLSATVSNAEEFGAWLGEVRGDTEVDRLRAPAGAAVAAHDGRPDASSTSSSRSATARDGRRATSCAAPRSLPGGRQPRPACTPSAAPRGAARGTRTGSATAVAATRAVARQGRLPGQGRLGRCAGGARWSRWTGRRRRPRGPVRWAGRWRRRPWLRARRPSRRGSDPRRGHRAPRARGPAAGDHLHLQPRRLRRPPWASCWPSGMRLIPEDEGERIRRLVEERIQGLADEDLGGARLLGLRRRALPRLRRPPRRHAADLPRDRRGAVHRGPRSGRSSRPRRWPSASTCPRAPSCSSGWSSSTARPTSTSRRRSTPS